MIVVGGKPDRLATSNSVIKGRSPLADGSEIMLEKPFHKRLNGLAEAYC
jgi:hypothetical protein